MIDTDKYKGHTEGQWCIDDNEESDYNENPNGTHIYALRLREDVAPHPISAGLPIAQHTGHGADAQLIADAPLLLAEVKRLQKENKILAKYMDIVQKYDDALLADGDTDPRWSELYD